MRIFAPIFMVNGANLTSVSCTKVLDVLKSSKNPLSTREISLKIEKSWYYVKKNCLDLKNKNLVCSIDAKNTTLWIFCDEQCKNGCLCGKCGE